MKYLSKYLVTFILFVCSGLAHANLQVNCLAKMAYFEARGETESARRVIMDVMINRVKHSEFPKTVCSNLKPSQFQWVRHNPRVKNWKLFSKIRDEASQVWASYLLGDWRDTSRGGIFFSSNGRKPAARAYALMKAGGHRVYGLRSL